MSHQKNLLMLYVSWFVHHNGCGSSKLSLTSTWTLGFHSGSRPAGGYSFRNRSEVTFSQWDPTHSFFSSKTYTWVARRLCLRNCLRLHDCLLVSLPFARPITHSIRIVLYAAFLFVYAQRVLYHWPFRLHYDSACTVPVFGFCHKAYVVRSIVTSTQVSPNTHPFVPW